MIVKFESFVCFRDAKSLSQCFPWLIEQLIESEDLGFISHKSMPFGCFAFVTIENTSHSDKKYFCFWLCLFLVGAETCQSTWGVCRRSLPHA